MRITKLQSIMTLSLTLVIGFASGYVARGFLPEQKAIATNTPEITFNSQMRLWPSSTYFNDFTCPASTFMHMNSLFDDILKETLHPFRLTSPFLQEASNFTLASTPEIDLKQTGNDLQLVLSAPGLKPEDVNVFMEDNRLVIKGRHKERSQNGFTEQSFVRTIDVPFGVDLSRIKKLYAEGAITVTVPRTHLSAAELPI